MRTIQEQSDSRSELAAGFVIGYASVMVTVLIEGGNDAGALGASLATLVSGAVEGLVREVVVLDGNLDVGTRKVADHAGCRIVPIKELRDAVGRAKGEWLLLLEPGARLAPDWIEAVAEHLAGGGEPRPARFSRSSLDRPRFLQRLRRRGSALRDGLVLPKAQAIALAGRRETLEGLAQGLATTRLAATIRPRPVG